MLIATPAHGGIGTQERDGGHSGGNSCQHPATRQTWTGDFRLLPEEAKLQTVVGTGVDAIEAQVTFGFAPGRSADGIVSALAVEETTIALIATRGIFMQAENRPARREAQECAQGTQRAAPEARHAQIERKEDDEDEAQQNAELEMRLPETEDSGGERGMEDSRQ
jgi:hypothetical protein